MIHDKLKKTITKLDNIPKLSAGGCGVVAYYLYKRLHKLGMSPQILLMGDTDYDYDFNIDVSTEPHKLGDPTDSDDWNSALGISFDHFMVKFVVTNNTYIMDGHMISPFKEQLTCAQGWELRSFNGHIDPALMKQLIKNKSNWNQEFDRDHIPEIIGIITKTIKV